MLAATSQESDRALETLKLVLLLESKEKEYPEILRKYFDTVMSQAYDLLLEDPEGVSEALPDAVSLAVKIKGDCELSKFSKQFHKTHKVSKEQAIEALQILEASFDSNCKPEYFSQDIYSTI